MHEASIGSQCVALDFFSVRHDSFLSYPSVERLQRLVCAAEFNEGKTNEDKLMQKLYNWIQPSCPKPADLETTGRRAN